MWNNSKKGGRKENCSLFCDVLKLTAKNRSLFVIYCRLINEE